MVVSAAKVKNLNVFIIFFIEINLKIFDDLITDSKIPIKAFRSTK